MRQKAVGSGQWAVGSEPRTEADNSDRFLSGWTRFWFSAINPRGLHGLRVLSGLLFLLWLVPLMGHQEALFGLHGWFDRQAYVEASRLPEGSPVSFGFSLLYLIGSNPTLVTALWGGAIVVFVLFTLGLWVRVTAVLTWVLVVSFLASPAVNYDADYLLAMLAFYLMIGYVFLGQWSRPLTFAGRLLGPRSKGARGEGRGARDQEAEGGSPPSYAANLALRLLQVHFALIMVVSGLHKLQFGDWWAGVAYWYPLHPPFSTTPDDLRAAAAHASLDLFFLSLVQYLALAWQIGFPFFAWRRRWRVVLLAGAILSWIGSIYIYGQPLFGPLYFIACLSYLTPAEWAWLTSVASGKWRVASGERQAGSDERQVSPLGTRHSPLTAGREPR